MSHAHDSHDFDGEPVKVLAPDEPRTPGWVPALGLLLFVGAGIAVLVCGQADAKTTATGAPDSAAAPAAAPVKAPSPLPSIVQNPGQNAAPGASGAPALTRLTPEQAKALQQRIDEARARQPQGGQPPGAPGGPPTTPPPSQPDLRRPMVPLPAPAPGGAPQ